jgi:PRTRC genetic system protein A
MIMINYLFAKQGCPLPPFGTGVFYEYITAANGVFIRSKRNCLEAMIPVMDMPYRPIRGLEELEPYVRLDTKVPAKLVGWALEQSNLALPNEVLFWLLPLSEGWRVHKPTQIATPGSVIPADKHDPIGAQAVIDLHSHGHARPFFSPDDDRDETGFRIYAVLGRIEETVWMQARVGIFGNTWPIDPALYFDLPENVSGIRSAYQELITEEPDETQP